MNVRSITMLSKRDHPVVINVVQSAIDTVNLMNLSIPFVVSMVPVSHFLAARFEYSSLSRFEYSSQKSRIKSILIQLGPDLAQDIVGNLRLGNSLGILYAIPQACSNDKIIGRSTN